MSQLTFFFFRGTFPNSDIAAAWLTSAHLSRKGNFTSQAYHSMLHAARLQDRSATIEHARLLWKDGHHRKAIQTLEGAISANEANNPKTKVTSSINSQTASSLSNGGKQQDVLITARVSTAHIFRHYIVLNSLGAPFACKMDGQGRADAFPGHCTAIS